MNTSSRLAFLALFLTILGEGVSFARAAETYPVRNKPKLLVVISIDQFRADYLTRFQSRFLPASQKNGGLGGFNYLISNGAYFPFGQYDILQSMTGPGHATILTGSYLYQSGIALNYWYDRETHASMYCAEDKSVATVGAQPKNPHVGTSPRNMNATTVGDELKNAGYPSRVVSIALKDRASILMGGHRADLSLWLDQESFHWVSSKFYLPEGELPPWMKAMNAELDEEKGKEYSWTLPATGATGLSIEGKAVHSLPTFPHVTKKGSADSLSLPYGLDLTARAVDAALKEYRLGTGSATDLLAISFSSHDYLGHAYGPNSREMEEMTVADDAAISKVLNSLKKRVPGGLRDVAIVLTADHGIPSMPEWLKENRVPAGRFDEKAIAAKVEERLNKRFGKPEIDGKPGKWLGYVESLNFHLDPRALADRKVKAQEVEEEIRAELAPLPGVAYIFTRTDVRNRHLPPGMFERQILHSYYDGRDGDVLIIPKPNYILAGEGDGHMTGYSYDRSVPIILSGRFFQYGVYPSGAAVIDIAPTLSFLTGTIAPSQSEGRVLTEALRPSELFGSNKSAPKKK